MVSVAAWFYVVACLIAGITLPVIIFMALVCPRKLVQLGDWLKGSRKIYFIDLSGNVRSDSGSFSYILDWAKGTVIETSHGFLRWRSAIYGEAEQNWRVTSDRAWPNTLRWVYLKERRGLRIEDALLLINTYPSLQAMLDRIAELEKASVEPLAVLRALDLKMLDDKQRFRSPAVKEIHANIRFALREIFVSGITSNPNEAVASWMERFEKPEAVKLQ